MLKVVITKATTDMGVGVWEVILSVFIVYITIKEQVKTPVYALQARTW